MCPDWDEPVHGFAVIHEGSFTTTLEYTGDQIFEVGDEVQWVATGSLGMSPKEKEPEKKWKPTAKPTGNGDFCQTSKWNH